MGYVLIILASYLLGSSSMAFYLGKLKKVDVQKNGSGNLGASNATVLFGWGAGVIVALHDIGKGLASVLLANWLFPQLDYAGVVAGVACVLGHIFPFYLKFKGGKGLASYLGVTIALSWKIAIVAVLLLVLVTVVTDYIALGTLATCVAVPVGLGILTQSLILPLILGVAALVMVTKHWENIQRIRSRTEIGLRSTTKGENRIDK